MESKRCSARLIANQRLFAFARHSLDRRFSLECLGPRSSPLVIDQANRSAAASVLRSLTCVVLVRSIEHVGGNSCVERIVFALEQIDEVRRVVSFLSGVVHRLAAKGIGLCGAIVRIPKSMLRNHSVENFRRVKIFGIRNRDSTAII